MFKKARQKAKIRGQIGEDAAKKHLPGRGYTILFTNFHSKFGEIDIIAEKDRTIFFIEVKTRTDDFKFGLPEEAMSLIKLRKMKKTIYEFFSRHPDYTNRTWKINLITVVLNSFEEATKIVHYKNVEIS